MRSLIITAAFAPAVCLSVAAPAQAAATVGLSACDTLLGGEPIPLLSTPPAALRAHYAWPSDAGKAGGADKARAVWSALRKGIDVLDSEEVALTKYLSPRLLRQLEPSCRPLRAAAEQSAAVKSSDGTQKLLLTLHDGLEVECVVIPISDKHSSLCVSSQVGCSRGCAFCSTGTMGLIRSLSTEEILAQVWRALRLVREQQLPKLVNIVFMGMGEPLNNLDAVAAAVDQLVAPEAFGFSRRNVCVSTVGPSPALIAKAGRLPCRLAWSVHAADDALRKQLVPTTRHSMLALRDAFIATLATKPGGDKARGLLVELALMRGVNDRPEHAEQLAALLHPFGRGGVLVNLIPYNENGLGLPGGPLFRSARLEDVHAFQRKLWDQGLLCTLRVQRGDDESAACGQLVTARTVS